MGWEAFYGMPGVISGAITLTLAALVLRAAPRRLANRALTLILGIEGLAILTGSGLAYLAPTLEWSMFFKWVALGCVSAGVGAYLFFLSTISAPIVAWLRPTPVRRLLLLATVAAPLLVVLAPERFVVPTDPNPIAGWETQPGDLAIHAYRALGLVTLLGLVAVISAWRAAHPGSVSRSRAVGYAAAFGIRDASFAATFLVIAPVRLTDPGSAIALSWPIVTSITSVIFVVILAYAILRTQLFDIDLRIKWTIRQGTLAGVFIAVFFVASELAQELFAEELGPILGIFAAGALVFVLAPLQRLADGLSEKAMPSVQPTSEYLAFRKIHVYRAAFESALEDGDFTTKERAVLERLKSELGVAPADAAAVEEEVRARFRPLEPMATA